MPSAAEVRHLGDATVDQRRQIRELIDGQAVSPQWINDFYAAVMKAGGLTRLVARGSILYLRSLPGRGEPRPAYATTAQAVALHELASTHLIPRASKVVRMGRLDAGDMTFQEADQTIREWVQMPLLYFVQPYTAQRRSGWLAADGHYTLRPVDGDPLSYRIRTTPATAARIVEQIIDGDPERYIKLHGHMATLIMREVAAQTDQAAALYGRTRNRCSTCNTALGEPGEPGRDHGYDPNCWATRQQAAEPGAAE